MILHNQIIQIFFLSDADDVLIGFAGIESGQRCYVGITLINGHYLQFAVVSNRFAKETQHGCTIPFGGQQKVDSLACRIHCAVQIFLRVFDFDMDLVYQPTTTLRTRFLRLRA